MGSTRMIPPSPLSSVLCWRLVFARPEHELSRVHQVAAAQHGSLGHCPKSVHGHGYDKDVQNKVCVLLRCVDHWVFRVQRVGHPSHRHTTKRNCTAMVTASMRTKSAPLVLTVVQVHCPLATPANCVSLGRGCNREGAATLAGALVWLGASAVGIIAVVPAMATTAPSPTPRH